MNALAPSLDMLKSIFADLGRTIEAAASSADGEWCGSITLHSPSPDAKRGRNLAREQAALIFRKLVQ
jgi:hypothetical protein